MIIMITVSRVHLTGSTSLPPGGERMFCLRRHKEVHIIINVFKIKLFFFIIIDSDDDDTEVVKKAKRKELTNPLFQQVHLKMLQLC